MIRVVCGDGRRLEYILIRSQRKNVLLQALPEGKNVVICGGQTAAGTSICLSAARDEHGATSGSRTGGFRLIITID